MICDSFRRPPRRTAGKLNLIKLMEKYTALNGQNRFRLIFPLGVSSNFGRLITDLGA